MRNVLVLDPADFMGGAEMFMLDFLSYADHEKAKFTVVTNGLPEYTERLETLTHGKVETVIQPLKKIKSVSPVSLWRFGWGVLDIWDIVKRRKSELILTNSIRGHVIGTYAARRSGVPIIWIIHDFTFPKFFIKRLAKTPEKIIVPSEAVAEFTKKQIAEEFHDKIVVIPNGVDLKKVEEAKKEDLREKLKLKPDAKLVGIVGRIDWWKGQDNAIDAIKHVHTKIPEAHLLIIGEPSSHDEKTLKFDRKIRRRVKEEGLEEHVTFTGFMRNIYGAIKSLDCLLHASTKPEPFGRVVIEGFACGVPVIASQLGGPGEVVNDGENGMLVNSNQPFEIAEDITKILTNEDFAKKLTTQARQDAEQKYSLTKVAQSIQQILLQ